MRQELRIASWYRGLSGNQVAAVRGLQSSLDTDAPHKSTKSVRQSMIQLGVSPLVGHAQLLQIASLSRHQDIAFLYFLMLAHYTCKEGATEAPRSRYTINEQQIMSAIAVLDLPLTLRALDKLLPPGVTKAPATSSTARQERGAPKAAKPTKDTTVSPYLQKQRRYKIREKPLRHISKQSNFQARFLDDAKMTDESAAIAESSRWFADYQLQPSRRYIKAILTEELSKLFDTIDSGKPPQDVKVLCAFHQATKDLKRDEYIMRARQRCLETIDLSARKKLQCRERILKQLEHNVQTYLEQFGERWNCHWSLVPTVPKRDCSVCCHMVGTPAHFQCRSDQVILLTNVGDANCHVSEAMCTNMSGRMKSISKVHKNFGRVEGGQEGNQTNSPAGCPLSKRRQPPGPERRTPLGERNRNAPGKTVPYMQAASQHVPYMFDYSRVFDIQSSKLETEDTVKGYSVRALRQSCDSPVETPSENLGIPFGDLAPIERLNAMSAVNKCVHNIWMKGLARSQWEQAQKVEHISSASDEPRNGHNRRTHYDPDDDQLMDQLLSDAMRKLRRDPKYVLASFPDSHCLPVLREWIKKRYGKWYTMETLNSFRPTSTKLSNLTKRSEPPFPKLHQYFEGNSIQIRYDEHALYKQKAENLKKAYQGQMKDVALERTRQVWHALNIHRTYGTGIYNTFFSYMPATIASIQPYFGLSQ